jgi:V8-like Glu-specific endopeptidase
MLRGMSAPARHRAGETSRRRDIAPARHRAGETSRRRTSSSSAVWLLGIAILGCGETPTNETIVGRALLPGKSTVEEEVEAIAAMPGVKSVRPMAETGESLGSSPGTGPVAAFATAEGPYVVEFDPEALEAAFSDVADPAGAQSGAQAVRGWSNGVDNRQRLTGASLVPEVGQVVAFSGGVCSGTLIGERIVRTAGHCIILHTTGGGQVPYNGQTTFNYRRDAGTIAASTLDQTFWYSPGYVSGGCATSTASDYWAGYRANIDFCRWKDWGYLILPRNWWNAAGWVQWMGYRMLGTGDLGLQLRMSGYPLCTQPHSPSGCVNNAEYEDRSTTCDVKVWTSGTAKWRSDCDTSGGSSGGSGWDPNTRQLIGHCQTEDCTTCPPGSTNRTAPNHFLGHDQWLFDFQQNLRATYPG